MVPCACLILTFLSVTSAKVAKHLNGKNVFFEITMDDDEETLMENSIEDKEVIENIKERNGKEEMGLWVMVCFLNLKWDIKSLHF